jgi:hypothetical protein
MRWLVTLLVACGGTQGPQEPTPIDNKAAPTIVSEPEQTVCRPRGVVYDALIGEPANGATIVFTGGATEQVAISDESGQFSLQVDRDHDRLTILFEDRAFEWTFQPSYCQTRVRITLDRPNVPQTPIVPY